MIEAYTNFIIKNCKSVIAVCVLMTLLAAAGAAKLGLTNEYQAFFSDENPQLQAFEKVQKTYSHSDNVLVMMLPKSGNVFEPGTLQAILDFTESAWQVPFVTRVDSLSNFQHTYGLDDDLIIEDLYSETEDTDLASLRKVALAQPLLINRLLSPTGDATAINITVKLEDEFDTPEVVTAVNAIIADLRQQHPDLEFYQSGVLMLNNALSEAILTDILTVIPFVYIVVALGVAYFVRSAYLTVISVILVTLSIAAAMGIAGWMGVVLTPPSASVPPIIMTLAVADCVHIFLTFQQKRQEGLNQHDAIVSSIDLNMTPVFLTSVTTALGFLSLNFSDAPPFRDLGNMTAIGVMFAFVLSMTFLPAMLAIRPIKSPQNRKALSDSLVKLADFVIAHRKSMLVIGLATAAVLSSFIPKNELNDNFIEYFDTPIKFRSDSDTITERLTGIYFVEYSMNSGTADGVTDPAFLQKVENFEKWLYEQPEVFHVNSIVEIIRKLHLNLHADDPQFYKLPDSKEAIAQYLLLYEMSLPNGLDLNSQINVNKSATRVSVSLESLSTTNMLAFEDRVHTWMDQNAPSLKSDGVSPSMMFSHISVRNIKSMLTGTAIALALISIILIIPLRSFRHGLLTLVSNLLPGAMAFGIWALLVGKISLGVSVVIAMTLGIVVDDTIHLISKFLRARRELGMDAEAALRYSFQTVGVALTATTVVLVAGFLVLATSSFQVNSHLSIVSAITITVALLVDFIIIPPLLLMIDSDKKHMPKTAQTEA